MMRIALIGPAFFGYLDRLAARMRDLGLDTQAFDERPSNRVLVKLALRGMPAGTRAQALRRHHSRLLDRLTAAGITHVMLVSVETIPPSWLAELERRGIRVSLYAWDSLANKPQMARLAQTLSGGPGGMTRVASFDPADCAATGMTYLPLFSLAPGGAVPLTADRPVDFLFCGTLHSDRASWLARFRRIAQDRDHRIEVMAFTPARSLWILRNLARPGDWRHLAHLQTRSFVADAVYAAMARARVVIDLPHPRQSGLTIRCFEAWSQGATVLSRGSGDIALTPDVTPPVQAALTARLIGLGQVPGRDLGLAMDRALACPTGPLETEAAAMVGAERFIGAAVALLAGI